jgi:hypothetical protein
MSAGFKITDRKGFRVDFANGYSVSVQWGPGSYCAARSKYPEDIRGSLVYPPVEDIKSATVEVAIMDLDEHYLTPRFTNCNGDAVRGWATPELVAQLMAEVAVLDDVHPHYHVLSDHAREIPRGVRY